MNLQRRVAGKLGATLSSDAALPDFIKTIRNCNQVKNAPYIFYRVSQVVIRLYSLYLRLKCIQGSKKGNAVLSYFFSFFQTFFMTLLNIFIGTILHLNVIF